MTPPSPFSPFTPPEVTLAEYHEQQRREKVNNEKKRVTLLLVGILQNFYKNDPFIDALCSIIKTHSSLEKRYQVAIVITNIMSGRDFDKKDVCAETRAQLAKEIFEPNSLLYQKLNYQKTPLLPLTFFGNMSWLSYNYSRSLQAVQAIVQSEKKPALKI